LGARRNGGGLLFQHLLEFSHFAGVLLLQGCHLLTERLHLIFEFLVACVAGLGRRTGGGKGECGSRHESPRA